MNRILSVCSVLSLIVLSSCSVNGNEKFVKSSTQTESFSAGKVTKLEVSQCAGKCNIAYGDTDKVQISSRCEISGLNEKNVTNVLENTKLQYSLEDDGLRVCFIDLSTGDELSSANPKTSLLKSVNITTDLDIVLPEDFDSFALKANVGDINLDSLSGSFEIISDVGDINLENVTLTGDSSIEANVGNVECSFKAADECGLDIHSNIGSIEIDTNGLDYREISKSDKLVEQEMEILIGDKCTAHLKADVGSIEIKK